LKKLIITMVLVLSLLSCEREIIDTRLQGNYINKSKYITEEVSFEKNIFKKKTVFSGEITHSKKEEIFESEYRIKIIYINDKGGAFNAVEMGVYKISRSSINDPKYMTTYNYTIERKLIGLEHNKEMNIYERK